MSNDKDNNLEQAKIGDHMLQYIVEPILVIESRYKYYTKRRNLSRMQIVGAIRSRVSFFSITNLIDKVDMKSDETDLMRKL